MPSERFWNLPAEKRERIRRAAVQEFERVPYEEASINKIVCTAKIPRGSFYQYFADKDDLLDFLTREYTDGMVALMDTSLAQSGGDAFYAVRQLFDYTVAYGTRPDTIKMCKNIFSSTRIHMKTTQEMLAFARNKKLIPEYFRNVSMENFRYTDENDLQDILELLVLLFREGIERIFLDISSRDAVRRSFNNKLKIVQNGIMKEAGN